MPHKVPIPARAAATTTTTTATPFLQQTTSRTRVTRHGDAVPYVQLVCAAMLFGLSNVLMRGAMKEHGLSPTAALLLRGAAQASVAVPYLWNGASRLCGLCSIPSSAAIIILLLLTVRAVAGALSVTLQFATLAIMPAGDATAVFSTVPLFATVFARLFLGERVGRAVYVGGLMAVCGTVVLATASKRKTETGTGTRMGVINMKVTRPVNVRRVTMRSHNAQNAQLSVDEVTDRRSRSGSDSGSDSGSANLPSLARGPSLHLPQLPSHGNHLAGTLYATAGAALAGSAYVCVRGLRSRNVSAAAPVCAHGLATTALACVLGGMGGLRSGTSSGVAIAAIAAGAAVMAQMCVAAALGKASVATATVIRASDAAFAYLFGVVVAAEVPGLTACVGAAMISAGSVVVVMSRT